MSTGQTLAHPIAVVPPFSAHVVSPGSPAEQQARLLQMQRYIRACSPSPNAYVQYRETVDGVPQRTIPLVIWRRDSSPSELPVGTASLELSSATTVEEIVQFTPGSPTAGVLSRGVFAEVGGFATRSDLTWAEVLDVLDTIGIAVVQLARQYGIEWFWFFPRRTMMYLLLAEIPGLLPPYHFSLCPDVSGWNEESAILAKIRKLHMKELPISPDQLPAVYRITPTALADDVLRRLRFLELRRQTPDLSRWLQTAMRQAQQHVHCQVALLNGQRKLEASKTGNR